ncbi:MAG: TonB-dependent receptor [Bacteroidia bacterium]
MKSTTAILIVWVCLSACFYSYGADFRLYEVENGLIYGVISDAQSGAPMAFASAGIRSLNIGATSDTEGRFRLRQVPPGEYEVEFRYLGYKTEVISVSIRSGEELKLDVKLSPEGVTLQTVEMTAQREGQAAAINQQINSNTIVNVVSKEKLQELPDQNAAEAVGRLAGVSLYRDGGEGQQVTVRGISPRFNNITINGERLPSTDPESRSVDLSMISPDMLAGIELYKALRPDMDGDAIGGTVNFSIRKAAPGFQVNGRALGGYNGLKNDPQQFRSNLSLSNRFADNKIGIIMTGNFQRANRSSEFLATDYVYQGVNAQTGEPIIKIDNLNLGDKLEVRDRLGGSVTADYTFNKNHEVMLSSSLGYSTREELRYRRRYRVTNAYQEFDVRERNGNTLLLSNSLTGKHHFGKLDFTWQGSLSSSDQNTPYSLSGRFRELSAINSQPQNATIEAIPGIFKNTLDKTIMYDSNFETSKVDEDIRTLQADLKYNFKLSKSINGYFKTGGKYRNFIRARDQSALFINPYLPVDNPARQNPELFVKNAAGEILMVNFLGDYTNDGYYNGKFDILPGTPGLRDTFTTTLQEVDIAAYNALYGTNYQAGQELPYKGQIDIEKIRRFYERYKNADNGYHINQEADLEDYDANESITAGYVMSEVNIGEKLMLMGGLRYENTRQQYTSRSGAPKGEDEGGTGFLELVDVSSTQGYDDFLPMAHLRYKAAKWMDVRLAYTRTLARPNFFNLVPWERINVAERIIDRGKPDLLHTNANNYDAFLSFYNKFGLLTLGGFYKELENIDYVRTRTIVGNDDFKGYSLTEPDNIEGISTVRGLEIDLQANLRPLGGFWNGIIIGANLTLARSQTYYPLFDVETTFIPTPPFFVTIVTDTVRSGPIVGQANIIANATLGYERKGFSGRISMIYQSSALSPGNPGIGSSGSGVGAIPEEDFYDASFMRFDLALKQRIDKKGKWTVMFNMNNITNTPERAFQGTINQLQEEEFFGFTADLGLMFKFSK